MNPKLKKISAAIVAAIPEVKPIYGFDRITLWLDRPDLPIPESVLRRHCTKLNVFYMAMKYNANWKIRVELFQPTIKCLQLLSKALGSDINVLINYVEIACDIPATSKEQADLRLKALLGSAQMKYQRQTVQNHSNGWYFGRRTGGGNCDQSEKAEDKKYDKRGNVMAVYADQPSKLNNAAPTSNHPPCLHIEWRSNGSAGIARLGIVSLDDLIKFNHEQFWGTHVVFYQFPKLTDLGRFLASAIGADTSVSGTALRKRATKWKSKNSIDGHFVMHNALLTTKGLNRQLSKVSFMDWMKDMLTADQD